MCPALNQQIHVTKVDGVQAGALQREDGVSLGCAGVLGSKVLKNRVEKTQCPT